MDTCECWTSILQYVLVSKRLEAGDEQETYEKVRRRHPPGIIWKKAAIQSVSLDLLELGQSQNPTHHELRFVHLNEFGLGGLILYEIPYGEGWTFKSVFGIPDDPAYPGMGIDELLTKINVKLTYIPLYACTSFAIGQVMNAFIHGTDTEDLSPRPTSQGFSVNSRAFLHRSADTDLLKRLDSFRAKYRRPSSICSETPSLVKDDSLDSIDVSIIEPVSPGKDNNAFLQKQFREDEKENYSISMDDGLCF